MNNEVQDWYKTTVCVFIVLHLRSTLNGDVYITRNMLKKSLTRYLLFTKEVSLAMMFITSLDKG
jgi:hypothetical protein